MVGGRTERLMMATWNRQKFILPPKDCQFSYFIALQEHKRSGHLGVGSTMARVRSKYWISGVRKLVSEIIRSCGKYNVKLKQLSEQVMDPLPEERLKPAPQLKLLA